MGRDSADLASSMGGISPSLAPGSKRGCGFRPWCRELFGSWGMRVSSLGCYAQQYNGNRAGWTLDRPLISAPVPELGRPGQGDYPKAPQGRTSGCSFRARCFSLPSSSADLAGGLMTSPFGGLSLLSLLSFRSLKDLHELIPRNTVFGPPMIGRAPQLGALRRSGAGPPPALPRFWGNVPPA
jgi:hypothetical protein